MINTEKQLHSYLKTWRKSQKVPKNYACDFSLTDQECKKLAKLDHRELKGFIPNYALYAYEGNVYVVDWDDTPLRKYPKEWRELLFEILSKRLYND